METRVLKQAVKRNLNRFPKDFMFVMTSKEIELMVSHFVIPSKSYFGGASKDGFDNKESLIERIVQKMGSIKVFMNVEVKQLLIEVFFIPLAYTTCTRI